MTKWIQVRAVQKLKEQISKTVGEVRQLAGILSYYRRYIKIFAKIARPVKVKNPIPPTRQPTRRPMRRLTVGRLLVDCQPTHGPLFNLIMYKMRRLCVGGVSVTHLGLIEVLKT